VLLIAAGAGVTKETMQLLLDSGAKASNNDTDVVVLLRFNLAM
jgi:hypothetical protein